jgi:hypothetical protein
MKRIALIACLLFSVAAVAQDKHDHAPKAKNATHDHAPKAKNATFEKLKSVLGDWEGKEGDYTFHISYKLVSDGTAIMETMAEGNDPPMINMYTPAGTKLTMVHYCASGNQPRMRADAPQGNEIAFNFVDVANLSDPKGEHMHDLKLRIVDADHIEQVWTSKKNDKTEIAVFKLTRVKAS